MAQRGKDSSEFEALVAAEADAVGLELAPPAVMSLGSKALRGSLWSMGGHGANMVLRLGSNLILTRLLFPEAFGLMALVSAFLTGLAMFSDLGLAPSIVQSSRGDDPRFLDTAWSLQIARGFGLWVLACLLAWPAAAFYDQPAILGLLPVAGIGVLIAGFNSTSLPRLQRHLAVAKMTLVRFAGHLSAVAVMLIWALIHPTVWALVAGGVVSSAVILVLSHTVVAKRRDRFAWDRDAARFLFHFGKWIFLSTVLTFLVGHADRLIFGKVIPLATLGVYSIAAMFATLPAGVLHGVGGTVIFPALSRKRESATGFEPAYRRARRPLLALGGFIVACLVASGPSLIETLYDQRYADAGWILQLLAIATWFRVLEIPYGCALLALGMPRWLAASNAFMLAGILAFVPLAFWLYGFPGAIGGFVASELLRYLVHAVGARRQKLPGAGGDILASVLLVVAAACGLYAGFVIGQTGGASLERLAGSVVIASLAWLPVSWFLLRGEAGRLAAELGFSLRWPR